MRMGCGGSSCFVSFVRRLLHFSLFPKQKAGDGAKNVVAVASVSARQCGTRVWSAVTATSAAMECTGMFGSPEMVRGCVGMALALA